MAVEIANGTAYGLTCAMITEDHFRASRLADRLEAGMIFVNNYMRRAFLGTPFGGVKGSGFGRENAAETLHEFVRAKNIRFPSASRQYRLGLRATLGSRGNEDRNHNYEAPRILIAKMSVSPFWIPALG